MRVTRCSWAQPHLSGMHDQAKDAHDRAE